MVVIRVSAKSKSTAVAGAIAGIVRDNGVAQVQAIGAGAVNQAVKAAIIAQEAASDDGLHVVVVPSFANVQIDGLERTAVRFSVEPR